jgi:hypothetical protein
MDFIFLDLREEELWGVRILHSIEIKKELFLLERLTKENFLFVIGLQDRLMRQAVKMIPLLVFGVKRDVIALLSP